MDIESNTDIKVYAKGLAFEGGKYDLRSLELIVSGYRSILDNLIAVELGKRQLTPAIKKQIGYEVEIREGSIELLIDFVFQHKELLALAATEMDGGKLLSESLVKLYKSAIDLRKAVSEALEQGININIAFNVNAINKYGDNCVVVNQQENKIEISNPKTLWAAQLTKSATDRILNNLDGKNIEYIDFESSNDKYTLTTDEKVILGAHKEVLPDSMEIIGRLDMVAFTSHKGEIVSEGETFPVVWDEEIRSDMQSIADVEGCVFKVKPIIDQKRLHANAIGFVVLECRNPQMKLLK
ncbi:MAG TPA: hypothetical protein VIM85_01865 [Pseudomonadales bacterium]